MKNYLLLQSCFCVPRWAGKQKAEVVAGPNKHEVTLSVIWRHVQQR